VTSFIIAVAGLVAAHSARACSAEFRYELLGYLLCIVGLGSIAFHAALQHWMQVCRRKSMPYMLLSVAVVLIMSCCVIAISRYPCLQLTDELPMLWAAVAACYCIINSKNPEYGGSKGLWLPIALIAWTALITCVTSFMHGTLQVSYDTTAQHAHGQC
jgi:Ceramidase